jgi:hypothetical protein
LSDQEAGFSLTGSVSLYPYCLTGRLDSHYPVLLVYIHIVRPGGWILINWLLVYIHIVRPGG